ncbi:MAG: hypothetical protein MSC31_18270 [Solirubrobacteraceae bacterium MAG38_C4-C5]|nr:hypothetical protein [Candidatus Siliceabacter maunaloa]
MVAVVASAVAAGPAAAQRTVSEEARPTKASYMPGALVWSSHDPATGRYHLMVQRRDEPPRRVPVAPRSVPFDVDVGDRRGLRAAYSRCEREPTGGPLPDWATGRGCDVYLLDLETLTEKKVRSVSTEQASEFLPSVANGGLAFARVYEHRSGLRGDVPYLYVKKIEAQRPSQRLPGTSRGRTGLPGPTALDLDDPGGNLSTVDGNRLGFAWEWTTDEGEVRSEVRIDRVAPRRIDLVEVSTDRALITPQFDRGTQFGFRGALFYAAACRPEPAGDDGDGDGECEGPSEIRKYATDAGRLETAPGTDNLTALTVSFRFFRGAGAARRARDPQRSCATDDGSRGCAVLELDRPGSLRTIPSRSG